MLIAGIEWLILRFNPQAGLYAKLLSVLMVSAIILVIYINCPVVIHMVNNVVYNSGQDESRISTPSPYGIKVTSNSIGTSPEFDVRNVSDVLLLTAVGKTSLAAIKLVSGTRSKAVVGVTTTLSLGIVGAGFKLMNQSSPGRVAAGV